MPKFEDWKLRKLVAKDLPKRVIYFDTETRYRQIDQEQHHRMKMAWCCFCRYDKDFNIIKEQWKFFKSPNRLWLWIESKAHQKQPLYVIAHNIHFDMQTSDGYYLLPKKKWKCDFYYTKGLTYILVISKGLKRIKNISSTNFFDTSLEKLGLSLGFEKFKIDFDTVGYIELKWYCRRDVEITKKAIEAWVALIKKHKWGKFCMTRAAQAMYTYRYQYMSKPIYIHAEKDVKALERKAYNGGRVECFYIGKAKGKPFVTVDVNSMYPYVMTEFEYPIRLMDYKKNIDLKLARDITKSFCIVCHCLLETDKPMYPIKQNNKLIFPIGKFRAYLCTEATKKAFEQDHIKEIYEIAIYRKDRIFIDFVEKLYPLKEKYSTEDNEIYCNVIKLFLNSLYGKWGQKFYEEEKHKSYEGKPYYKIDTYDLITGEQHTETKLFNTIIIQKDRYEPKNGFPAIAGHITENARMMLWDMMDMVGHENVLYVDTDGLKIRKQHLHKIKHLLHDTHLGALSIDKESQTLEILGAKAYIEDGLRIIKGLPKTAIEQKDGGFEYMSFQKQATHLRRQTDRYHIVKRVIKYLTRKYDKGHVDVHGHVHPFRLTL